MSALKVKVSLNVFAVSADIPLREDRGPDWIYSGS